MPLLVTAATADVIIHDDFDDGTLDPAWQIFLEHASGWAYEESGTNLIVSDIDAEVVNPGGGETRAVVHLVQACPSLTDLHVDFQISWDCLDTDAAMQRLRVSLIDGSGNAVISAGLSDPWIGSRPCRFALIGNAYECQWDGLPYSGTGSIDIDRTGDQVTVLWDDVPVLSDSLAVPIDRVEITFAFYAREGSPDSVFGSESVDLLTVQGISTAVEAQSWGTIKEHFR